MKPSDITITHHPTDQECRCICCEAAEQVMLGACIAQPRDWGTRVHDTLKLAEIYSHCEINDETRHVLTQLIRILRGEIKPTRLKPRIDART